MFTSDSDKKLSASVRSSALVPVPFEAVYEESLNNPLLKYRKYQNTLIQIICKIHCVKVWHGGIGTIIGSHAACTIRDRDLITDDLMFININNSVEFG